MAYMNDLLLVQRFIIDANIANKINKLSPLLFKLFSSKFDVLAQTTAYRVCVRECSVRVSTRGMKSDVETGRLKPWVQSR